MEIFSEIYNCYYQVLRHLLCTKAPATLEEMRSQVCQEGFLESMLSIIPKLESGSWNLLRKDGNLYLSKLTSDFTVPISALERSYLKALLNDARIGLFLTPSQTASLGSMLAETPPLWKPEQFYYYDRFADGDPYQDENYRRIFRTLLGAQKNRQYVNIDYTSPQGKRVHHYYVPARLEYSVKNDKFRLLALEGRHPQKMKLAILNISRMQNVTATDQTLDAAVDLNQIIRDSYEKEPLRLHITNKRNALERAMLHFANYEKNTKKVDENNYECLIYYNKTMETELLIEVLSFGPMLKVVGNDSFLADLKTRLLKQQTLQMVSSSTPHITETS